MVSRLAALRRRLEAGGVPVVEHQPIGPLTTYRVGGAAALSVLARAEDDLVAVRLALAGTGVPVLVLGKGSNTLVSDGGFDGLVVRLGPAFEAAEVPVAGSGGSAASAGPGGGGGLVVRAGGAMGLPVLARRTVGAGLRGLEWAVGVPGSVGGAVRMNAGGHGSDIAAHLVRYRWVDLDPPDVDRPADPADPADPDPFQEDQAGQLSLAYRSSSLRPSQVVVWAELRVRPGNTAEGRAELSAIVAWRRRHQPGGSNAGSVFTNPPGDSAGRLIEAAGLKGFRVGTAAVSPKHANFIQADDGGSADDVLALMHQVAARVRQHSGVDLHAEVRLIGFSNRETVCR